MVRITIELLRKRAEHNEGEISTLEEVSLHQFDIERIELLDKICRHLKILYLQNNIIPKMENLNRLKELEYLNLALNNISMIEGLSGCESLKKLDLTLNFIGIEELEESMVNLSGVSSLEQLYLTGNPCTDWENCREFVIGMVPQVKQLDGIDVSHTERLTALQNLPSLTESLREMVRNKSYPQKNTNYTKEARIESAQEAEKIRVEKEESTKKQDDDWYGVKKVEPASVYNSAGEVRQCNQGGYKFDITEEHKKNVQYIVFELFVPKYLETSMINVDINPTYVRIDVKGKITQIKFHCEIHVEKSKAQRSQTTGALSLYMPKVVNTPVPYYKLREDDEAPINNQPKSTQRSDEKEESKGESEVKQQKPRQDLVEDLTQEQWEDDDDVPPLE